MVVAAMQGANQQIRSNFGFSILPKDALTCRSGDSNQQPSDNNNFGSTPEPKPATHFTHVDEDRD